MSLEADMKQRGWDSVPLENPAAQPLTKQTNPNLAIPDRIGIRPSLKTQVFNVLPNCRIQTSPWETGEARSAPGMTYPGHAGQEGPGNHWGMGGHTGASRSQRRPADGIPLATGRFLSLFQ